MSTGTDHDNNSRPSFGALTPASRRRAPRWSRVAIIAGATLLVLVIVVGGAATYLFGRFRNNITQSTGVPFPKPQGSERVNILVMGLDQNTDANGKVITGAGLAGRRSDTLMLFSGDPDTKQISVISIPRDSRVEIPGHGLDKINAAHAYGGPALAMETVSNFLGVPVHYYARSSFDGFAKLVDLLGGVEYTVEKDMYYPDPTQNLLIDLKKGPQTLTGDKAVQYWRYRADSDDIVRISRQQKLLRAVVAKAVSPGQLLRLPKIAVDMYGYIDTNLGLSDILTYAGLASGFNSEDMQVGTVPGTGTYIDGISYWVTDVSATHALVDQLIRGIDPAANAKIRVEVLNGSTDPGAAQRFSDWLRADGFAVVNVAAYGRSDIEQTLVIDHRGDSKLIDCLSRTIEPLVPDSVLQTKVDQASASDITVVVGSDCPADLPAVNSGK